MLSRIFSISSMISGVILGTRATALQLSSIWETFCLESVVITCDVALCQAYLCGTKDDGAHVLVLDAPRNAERCDAAAKFLGDLREAVSITSNGWLIDRHIPQ